MIDKTPETSRQGMRSDKNLIENTLRLRDIFWVIFITEFSVLAEISSFLDNFRDKLVILRQNRIFRSELRGKAT